MKKIFAFLVIGLLFANALFAQKTVKTTVYFDHDKYSVQEASKARLDSVFKTLNSESIIAVSISGHTDADGTNGYNDTLSHNRAKTVSDLFISNGIEKNKIKIEYFGETKPVATNETNPGKQKNRRVEINITFTDTSKEAIMTDIFSEMKKESQSFKSSGSQEISFIGKEGTKITIPAYAFETLDGKKVTGEIKIELKEFYKISDMIAAGLTTAADSDQLETGGMIYIEATSGGQKLKLTSGALMEIVFKNKTVSDSMGLFTGEEENNKINWKLQHAENAAKGDSLNLTEKYLSMGTSQESPVNGMFSKTTLSTGGSRKGMTKITGGVVQYGYDSATTAKNNTFNNLILSSNKLGWLNCDHFTPRQNLTNLVIKVDPVLKPSVRLVFKSLNSIMEGYYYNDDYVVFNNIPAGKKVIIVGYGKIGNDTYYAAKSIIITKDKPESLELSKITVIALADELTKLDK